MLSSGQRTREEVSPCLELQNVDPGLNGCPSLVGDFKLDRPARFLLDHCRSVPYAPSNTNIVETYSDEITPPQLAVDRQIEHREIASAAPAVSEHGSSRPLSVSKAAFDRRSDPCSRAGEHACAGGLNALESSVVPSRSAPQLDRNVVSQSTVNGKGMFSGIAPTTAAPPTSRSGPERSNAMAAGTSAVRCKPERRSNGLDRCSWPL
jgi:hypothetical protein